MYLLPSHGFKQLNGNYSNVKWLFLASVCLFIHLFLILVELTSFKVTLTWFVSIESDSHFAPDPEALQDTLREPLPPKQPVMGPKWLMSSTPEPGCEGPHRTTSGHPTTQYSSPSAATSKPVRSVSSAGASTQQTTASPLTSTSQATKQPPLPPPKPVNRGNAAMLGKSCWIFHTREKLNPTLP